MKKNITKEAEEIYAQLYPKIFSRFAQGAFVNPVPSYSLREVRIRPIHSSVMPFDVDLGAKLGPVKLNLALMSAAMDAVSGVKMLQVMHEIGGVGIAYRDKKAYKQIEILKEALCYNTCMVANPKYLKPSDPLEEAQDILREFDYSTIPVVGENKILEGILFTRDVAFKGHTQEPVKNWMIPFGKLKHVKEATSFESIRKRLLDEQNCNVLPVVDNDRRLGGIYFMVDFFMANPAWFNGKPLVGMAVGAHDEDIDRVHAGLDMGVGIICVDSSHGNSAKVLEQTKKIVELADGRAAIVAGNIADIDGYIRFADAGADAVKLNIGSGAICTTSSVTGAGFGAWTLLRECRAAQKIRQKQGKHAPLLISDGGIEGPGDYTVAMAAGAGICMAGKWLAAAKESLSCQSEGVHNHMVKYWGMASKRAIKSRQSDRYGMQKTAPEGVEGLVVYRGPLKKWLGQDLELIQGGFAHAGAANIDELHEICDHPMAFTLFTTAGQAQIAPSVKID